MTDKEEGPQPSDFISGSLNLLGFKIDLKELLDSPESLKDSLGRLRDSLKEAGGKEALSDDEWRQGGASITGHIRTRGLLGERDFHLGTLGRPGSEKRGPPSSEPSELIEPPVDVFEEGEQVTIVADIPGASLEDIELRIDGDMLYLSTKKTARRRYMKELRLGPDVEPASLQSQCRNGVLEVRLRKRGTVEG